MSHLAEIRTLTLPGVFLIYQKLKSLIIHIPRVEIVNHSYTELGGDRGTVGTEEHRGITEER